MIRIPPLLLLIFLLASCGQKPKRVITEQPASDTSKFFPLENFFRGQIDYVDLRDFPIYRVTQKYGTLKSARGHSYKACELALAQLASHRFPLEDALTHSFGLSEVDKALQAVAGKLGPDVIHVSIDPWKASP